MGLGGFGAEAAAPAWLFHQLYTEEWVCTAGIQNTLRKPVSIFKARIKTTIILLKPSQACLDWFFKKWGCGNHSYFPASWLRGLNVGWGGGVWGWIEHFKWKNMIKSFTDLPFLSWVQPSAWTKNKKIEVPRVSKDWPYASHVTYRWIIRANVVDSYAS